MSTIATDQKRLWKLIQIGNLKHVETFLQSLDYDTNTLLHKEHHASGDTPVHLASRHGYLNMVKFFRWNWNCDVKKKNLDGKTPLHEAASNGHVGVCEYLFHEGVDVDCLKRNDWTPLMMACTKPQNLATVKQLVDHGARVDLVNKDGWDCFHIACRQGDLEMVRYIFSCNKKSCESVSKNGRTPLHTAALHGQFEVLYFLLDTCCISLECQDSCGSTPLMEAVKGGHFVMVKDILRRNADVDAVDNLGRTVLHVAAENNQVEVIQYLIEQCDVDPNARTRPANNCELGHSALDWAYKEQQTKAIEMLKKLGAVDIIR